MAKRRSGDFDLRTVMARRDFTPGASDVPSLLAFVVSDDEDAAKDATLALARIPDVAVSGLDLGARPAEARARIARMLSRFPRDLAFAPLLAMLDDDASVVRRASAQALARLGAEGAQTRLIARLAGADAAEVRALANALGRTESEDAAAALRALDVRSDAALAQIVERGLITLGRSAARETITRLDAHARMARPVRVELLCRAGLESMLAETLTPIAGVRHVRARGRGLVEIELHAAPHALQASRLFHTIRFPLSEAADEASAEDSIARVIASDEAREIFTAFTDGTPRIRVAFEDGKKRRATAWGIAAELDARGLVNDPENAPWHAQVRAEHGALRVSLVPRGFLDERFAYRVADVPASTHPTIAAAMARLCPLGAHEVVWDPFAGAGVELVERARLGPYAKLVGTDVDARALDAARVNLGSLAADLHLSDATTFVPRERPTTILSNPPMGKRVARGEAENVLEAFATHLGRVAADAATLVWLNPLPKVIGPALEASGFRLERAVRVDMGGFEVSLETWRRGASGRR